MNNYKNILFVHYGDNWIRGSEACLINLIASLNKAKFRPVVWSNCEPLTEHFKKQSIPTVYTPFKLLLGWSAPRFNLYQWGVQLKQAISLIKQHDIDIVHINSGAPCQWMCIAAKLCGIPVVTQLHSDYQLRDRFTLGLHLSPNIACVSHDISKGLLDDGYPQDQLCVIHNGVVQHRTTNRNVRAELNIPKSSFVFITVGSLIVRKGVDLIIQSLNRIQGEKDAHLVVIGDGEDRDNLIALVNDLGVTCKVHFVGEREDVADWLCSDVDAFISGARYEAFGLVLAEAGLAKLPVIAPRVGGIPEFIHHNRTGLLFDPSNPIDEMCLQMTRLMSDAALRTDLSAQLHHLSHSKLTVEANTQQFERLYSKVIRKNDSSSLLNGLKPLVRWAFH